MNKFKTKSIITAFAFFAVLALAFSVRATAANNVKFQADSLLSADSAGVIPANANINAEVNAAVSGNSTAIQNTSFNDLSSTISEDTPHGLGLFFTRIRYAFANNPDNKATLGLKIAQSHLLNAEKNFRNGDDSKAQSEMQKYNELQAKIAGKYNQSPGSDSVEGAKAKFIINKRLELNAMFTQQFQERINNSNLTAEQKDKILSAIEDAKNKTQEANMAVLRARQQVLAALNSSGKNVSSDDLEAEAEAQVNGGGYGDNRSAQVMIISAARLMVKANSVYGNYSALANASDNTTKEVMSRLDDAKVKLKVAKVQYDAGKYAAAKEQAMQARAEIVAAYRLMLTSSGDTRLLVQARLEDNHKLQKELEDRARQKLGEREQENSHNGAPFGLRTVNETLRDRLQNMNESQGEIKNKLEQERQKLRDQVNNVQNALTGSEGNESAGADMNASAGANESGSETAGNSTDSGSSSSESGTSVNVSAGAEASVNESG